MGAVGFVPMTNFRPAGAEPRGEMGTRAPDAMAAKRVAETAS
jgi:hypothetical protein